MRSSMVFLLSLVGLFNAHAMAEEKMVDPTRPPDAFLQGTTIEQGSLVESMRSLRLTLQSIWYVESAATATINNEIYRVGDRVGEWAVTDIGANEVTLQREEEIMRLTVFEQGQLSISKESS
ncbi:MULTISPECIES: hypothetical protein [Gammaproteobacteria]|uniref:hypothetical protein n=1 Tax=Gammaproteobacteria TaxID=1236 RepID=UPI000DCF8E4B|nr:MULTISPECIES: hypothetical protein [Gammaproteobacteria]RTE86392.1 hypothetical protein DQX04_07470 [Aliidiomarina sp. B3213]TCZ91739.1 hypothetical protein EYQ95_07475 [Lysobacter sp. N42]